jgi:DNA polymerase-4
MLPAKPRRIIHVDMDAFYASVETRDRPELRGRPVIVGGPPGSRGVVASASYEARRFGVRSAMPSGTAFRLCPDAVFIHPDFEKYHQVSHQIQEVFHRYTPLVEPVSLDEAYLDVTDHLGSRPSATEVARAIKADIRAETQLTASAGVAPNKFLAKIASDEKKPDGLFVIRPQDVAVFVYKLPLGKIPGIGKATQAKLEEFGWHTCGDLQSVPVEKLTEIFGKRGGYFHNMVRGLDDRVVQPHRLRKSVGIEDTFAEDHADPAWLQAKLRELAQRLETRLRGSGLKGRTLTVKVRFSDFRTFTRSRTVEAHTDEAQAWLPVAQELFSASVKPGQALRLLGLSVAHLDNEPEPEVAETPQLDFPWAAGSE